MIASIHQPSTSTFDLFDKLLLLSAGKSHFFGPVSELTAHYHELGYQVPMHVNPAEFVLELVNTDFAVDREAAVHQLGAMQRAWAISRRNSELMHTVQTIEAGFFGQVELEDAERKPSLPSLTITLLHRSFVKSYRDVVVYGMRLAMYLGACTRYVLAAGPKLMQIISTGLAIMMGTVWVRLSTDQSSIIPLTNAIVSHSWPTGSLCRPAYTC